MIKPIAYSALLLMHCDCAATGGRCAPYHSKGKSNVLNAKTFGTFMSPDKQYSATLRSGEASVDLVVSQHAPNGRQIVFSERCVTGIIWDPSQRHRLIFSESAIYGVGKIAVWNGRFQRVIWNRNVHIEALRWDLKRQFLSFHTCDEFNKHWLTRTIHFR